AAGCSRSDGHSVYAICMVPIATAYWNASRHCVGGRVRVASSASRGSAARCATELISAAVSWPWCLVPRLSVVDQAPFESTASVAATRASPPLGCTVIGGIESSAVVVPASLEHETSALSATTVTATQMPIFAAALRQLSLSIFTSFEAMRYTGTSM